MVAGERPSGKSRVRLVSDTANDDIRIVELQVFFGVYTKQLRLHGRSMRRVARVKFNTMEAGQENRE